MLTLDWIIRAYGPGLARVASSYEADRGLREDLTQDMLLAIHRALPALRDEARIAPFVYRIAHNRGVSHVLRRKASREVAEHAEPPDPAATPEQQLLAGERHRRLERAVRRLPLPYRQVITLVLEDLSYAEIAAALGLTLSNVGVRVSRAKAQLKEMLDDD